MECKIILNVEMNGEMFGQHQVARLVSHMAEAI